MSAGAIRLGGGFSNLFNVGSTHVRQPSVQRFNIGFNGSLTPAGGTQMNPGMANPTPVQTGGGGALAPTGGSTSLPSGFGNTGGGGTGGQLPDFIQKLIDDQKANRDRAEQMLLSRQNQAEALGQQAIDLVDNDPLTSALRSGAMGQLTGDQFVDPSSLINNRLRRAAADRTNAQRAVAGRAGSAGVGGSRFVQNLQSGVDRNIAADANRDISNIEFQSEVDARDARQRGLQLASGVTGQLQDRQIRTRGMLADILNRLQVNVPSLEAGLGDLSRFTQFNQGGGSVGGTGSLAGGGGLSGTFGTQGGFSGSNLLQAGLAASGNQIAGFSPFLSGSTGFGGTSNQLTFEGSRQIAPDLRGAFLGGPAASDPVLRGSSLTDFQRRFDYRTSIGRQNLGDPNLISQIDTQASDFQNIGNFF